MTGNSGHRLTGVLTAIVAALLLVCFGCGAKAERDKTADQAVSDFVRRVNQIVKNDRASWPQEVPDDVPPFTRGTIVSADKALTADGTSWTILITDAEEGSWDAYADALRETGWEATVVKSDSGGSCSARRESLGLTLNFSGSRGTLVVRLTTF